MTYMRDETVLKVSQRLRDSMRMFAKLPEDAEVIFEFQQCRLFNWAIPRYWQDNLVSSGNQYHHLNDLIMSLSRIY